MRTNKYETRRARVFIEKYGTGALLDAGNVDSFTVSANEETIEKKSSSEVIGTIASKTLSTDWEGNAVFGSTDFDTFLRVVRGVESAIAAVTDGTATFPAGEAGTSFQLPHSGIITASWTGLTEGTDYILYKASGIVTRLTDVIAPVEDGTYTSRAGRGMGIGNGPDQEYTIHVANELLGEYTQWFRAKFKLPTNIQAINPNEFATYEVAIKFLQDESKPANGPFGQIGSHKEYAFE